MKDFLLGKKIAIPSDPEIRLQALSVHVERSCELSLPKARRLSACETLSSLVHYTEVSPSRRRPLRGFDLPANLKTSNKTSRDRTWLLPTKLAHSSTDIFRVN
jgi:hypothetical protein